VASVTLNRVWLHLASDPSQQLGLPRVGDGREYEDELDGEVRTYAAGRRRLITTPARVRAVTGLELVVTVAQYAVLNSWVGQIVLYRDGHGVKQYGALLATPWKPLQDNGTARRVVTLELPEVTFSEAV
jgi:hypothetical protein